jgi:hypothetical protein
MEDSNDYIIVQVIKGFLGQPKNEYDALSKNQWQFNCPSPKCRHDVDKFNLEYNSVKHLSKCWKCDYRAFVYQLAQDYGSDTDLQRIQSILPPSRTSNLRSKNVNKVKIDHHLITCNLPEGYLPLGVNRNTPLYKLAWDYLVNERKVSPSLIDKYQIGYTETGPRRFRIIIPSKNTLGRINYYEARSFLRGPKVIPYIKPPGEEVHKNDIIFNEYFINWDIPVFLVEGVFDMFRLPNSIPVLGKEVSNLLISEILKYKPIVILCFDPDAIEKTVETYAKLSSLGVNVFFVDLRAYNKDISQIFEDHGKEEVANAVRNIKRLDLSMQISKNLKD